MPRITGNPQSEADGYFTVKGRKKRFRYVKQFIRRSSALAEAKRYRAKGYYARVYQNNSLFVLRKSEVR
jgi:hypothetical protein